MPKQFVQSRVLNYLRLAAGRVVSSNELIEAMYYDREEPDYASDMVDLTVMELRRRNFPIRNISGRGFYFAPTFHDITALYPAQ